MRFEGLRKLKKKSIELVEIRTHDLPVFRVAPQSTTLPGHEKYPSELLA
jgi:hypothetical protein